MTSSDSVPIVVLQDPVTGARAQILVRQGFNCFSWTTPVAAGERDWLWAVEGFEKGDKRPSSSGIPLLFPFPGRIQGTSLAWEGRDYPLQAGDAFGNAIHGFVHTRPWRIVSQTDVSVTGEFQAARDDATLLAHWPTDFRIRATYTLDGPSLIGTYELANTGTEPLPCGFGTHPYFRLPLGPEGTSADCELHLPVRRRWELHDMIATGRVLDVPDGAELQAGFPLGARSFDDVFTDLVEAQGEITSWIDDRQNARRLSIRFPRPFRECVVYTPPHRQAVCIEPYSCVPDAARLARQGLDTGLWVLAPGAHTTVWMNLSVEPL